MWVILAALAGAVLYRARGNGLWNLPRPTWQALFALPYAAAVFWPLGPLAAFVVLALTTGAVLTGHASYLDLGEATRLPADGQSEEWYGTWIPWPGTYAHDFIGLAVSGLLVTLPAGLACAAGGDLLPAMILALSGALKAPAYALGTIAARPLVSDKLKICEPLCGAALWGSLAAILTG